MAHVLPMNPDDTLDMDVTAAVPRVMAKMGAALFLSLSSLDGVGFCRPGLGE